MRLSAMQTASRASTIHAVTHESGFYPNVQRRPWDRPASAVTSDPHNDTGGPSHAGDHRDVVAQAHRPHRTRQLQRTTCSTGARYDRGRLSGHELYATGTMGVHLATELHLPVTTS